MSRPGPVKPPWPMRQPVTPVVDPEAAKRWYALAVAAADALMAELDRRYLEERGS